jgi:hypothetical protein
VGPAIAIACLCADVSAETIRFRSPSDWRTWDLPLGIVQLSPGGTISTVAARQRIDAVANAVAFGGGIRGAGSNEARATRVLDGDGLTGWRPAEDADTGDRWLELDLGRAVAADRVEFVFAREAPPFPLFDVLLSTGEPAVDLVANPIPGSLVYSTSERFRENGEHVVGIDLDLDSHPFVRVIRIDVLGELPLDLNAQLVEIHVLTVGDNLALDLPDKGGNIEIVIDIEDNYDVASLGNSLALADGDFSLWTEVRRINRLVDVISRMTLDLGAVYSVDLVRMVADFMRRPGQFRFNFESYEVQTSDGSLALDGTLIWHRQFAGRASRQNRDLGIANHPFQPLPTRYVRVEWVFWDAVCAALAPAMTVPPCQFWGGTRELQVFGEGHPLRARLRSSLIDLGGPKRVTGIRWSGSDAGGARIEVSSRTGNDLEEEVIFRNKDGKQVTERVYNRLIPSFRGPIDTLLSAGDDWSPWSRPYLVADEAFQSPVPRSYLELQMDLISDGAEGASLDWLEIEVHEPIATRARVEITPTTATAGQATEFRLLLLPAGLRRTGFDQIEVEGSTEMTFLSVRAGESEIDVEETMLDRGFRLDFPAALTAEELVELRLRTAVFIDATQFDLFIADSSEPGARQRVDAGEADADVDSQTNVVRLPVDTSILDLLRLSSAVITPNGDGHNDELRLEFDLRNAIAARATTVTVFDLSGRAVWENTWDLAAGTHAFEWPATGRSGREVPPGLYVLRVLFGGDAGDRSLTQTVAVAY